MKLKGQGDDALTPATAHPGVMTTKGSAPIQGIKIDSSVVFVEAGRDKVREIQFDLQSVAHVSRDLTLLAEHIPQGDITQMVRQRRPHEIIWFVNGARQLAGVKLDYVESILAWQREVIDGEIFTVEVVPQFNKLGPEVTKTPWEEIYIGTKRILNGATKYCVERLDFTAINHPKTVTPGVSRETDCAVTASNAVLTSSITAAHLIGETVTVIGDGIERGTQLVPGSGIVTVSPPAKIIDVGLPFTAVLESVPPYLPGGPVIMGIKKRWIYAGVKLHKTSSVKVNGERIDAKRAPGDVIVDETTGAITGDVPVNNFGYSRNQTIIVERDRPLHATILAMFGQLHVGQQ